MTMKLRTYCQAFGAAALIALTSAGQAQTTTTTVTTGAPTVAERSTTTVVRGRVGTVSPDLMMMDHSAGTEPVSYVTSSRTVYVDSTGATVPLTSIRAGDPVSVEYAREGERYIANRVVVDRRVVTDPAPVVESRTIVTDPAPRTTIVERPASTVVERPTVIERREPAVIEKKTRTTTTTVEPKAKVKKREVEIDVDDDDDDD